MKYYHGGSGSLTEVDKVLPATLTGKTSTSEYGGAGVHNKSKVYVTTSYLAAMMYACVHPLGAVYEVNPEGDLMHDPDCDQPGLSFECASAVIIRVHRLSRKTLNKIRKKVANA